MTLTIEIKESAAEKILYFLNHFKDDVKVIKREESALDIEAIKKNDADYTIIMNARKERKLHPENYIEEDKIDWND